jgi:hypothetical protein
MTQIKIPPLDFHMSPEAKALIDPKRATHNILVGGKLLPVIKMFGMEGQEVSNPLHAFAVIVYEAGQYLHVKTQPGELWPITKKKNT